MMDSASRCVWDLFGKDPDDTGCVIDVEAITLDKEKVTPKSPKILPKNGTATGVSGGTIKKNIKIDTEANHSKTFGWLQIEDGKKESSKDLTIKKTSKEQKDISSHNKGRFKLPGLDTLKNKLNLKCPAEKRVPSTTQQLQHVESKNERENLFDRFSSPDAFIPSSKRVSITIEGGSPTKTTAKIIQCKEHTNRVTDPPDSKQSHGLFDLFSNVRQQGKSDSVAHCSCKPIANPISPRALKSYNQITLPLRSGRKIDVESSNVSVVKPLVHRPYVPEIEQTVSLSNDASSSIASKNTHRSAFDILQSPTSANFSSNRLKEKNSYTTPDQSSPKDPIAAEKFLSELEEEALNILSSDLLNSISESGDLPLSPVEKIEDDAKSELTIVENKESIFTSLQEDSDHLLHLSDSEDNVSDIFDSLLSGDHDTTIEQIKRDAVLDVFNSSSNSNSKVCSTSSETSQLIESNHSNEISQSSVTDQSRNVPQLTDLHQVSETLLPKDINVNITNQELLNSTPQLLDQSSDQPAQLENVILSQEQSDKNVILSQEQPDKNCSSPASPQKNVGSPIMVLQENIESLNVTPQNTETSPLANDIAASPNLSPLAGVKLVVDNEKEISDPPNLSNAKGNQVNAEVEPNTKELNKDTKLEVEKQAGLLSKSPTDSKSFENSPQTPKRSLDNYVFEPTVPIDLSPLTLKHSSWTPPTKRIRTVLSFDVSPKISNVVPPSCSDVHSEIVKPLSTLNEFCVKWQKPEVTKTESTLNELCAKWSSQRGSSVVDVKAQRAPTRSWNEVKHDIENYKTNTLRVPQSIIKLPSSVSNSFRETTTYQPSSNPYVDTDAECIFSSSAGTKRKKSKARTASDVYKSMGISKQETQSTWQQLEMVSQKEAESQSEVATNKRASTQHGTQVNNVSNTPHDTSAPKKSTLLRQLSTTAGYIADKIVKESDNLYDDPSKLAREDRALQRAMMQIAMLEAKPVNQNHKGTMPKDSKLKKQVLRLTTRSRAKISIRPVKSMPTSTKARSHHKMNKQTAFQRKGHSRMLVNRSSPRLNKDGIICRINMKELRKRKYEHHVKMALTKKVKIQLTPLNVDNLPKRKTPTARKTTDNKHTQRDRQKTTSKTKRRLISYKDYKSSIKQPSVLPLQKKSTSIFLHRNSTESNMSEVDAIPPAIATVIGKIQVSQQTGETVLHRAARLGYEDVAHYCAKKGYKHVNAKDNAGYTPLHNCCMTGQLGIAKCLIYHGASVNLCHSNRVNALHDAVRNNHLELVRLLLLCGGDIILDMYSGKDVIDMAVSNRMRTFLKGYFQDMNGSENSEVLHWQFPPPYIDIGADVNVAYDILKDVPEDDDDLTNNNVVMDSNDTQPIEIFNLCISSKCFRNYALLKTLLQCFGMVRQQFLSIHEEAVIANISRASFLEQMANTMHGNLQNLEDRLHLRNLHGKIELVLVDNFVKGMLGVSSCTLSITRVQASLPASEIQKSSVETDTDSISYCDSNATDGYEDRLDELLDDVPMNEDGLDELPPGDVSRNEHGLDELPGDSPMYEGTDLDNFYEIPSSPPDPIHQPEDDESISCSSEYFRNAMIVDENDSEGHNEDIFGADNELNCENRDISDDAAISAESEIKNCDISNNETALSIESEDKNCDISDNETAMSIESEGFEFTDLVQEGENKKKFEYMIIDIDSDDSSVASSCPNSPAQLSPIPVPVSDGDPINYPLYTSGSGDSISPICQNNDIVIVPNQKSVRSPQLAVPQTTSSTNTTKTVSISASTGVTCETISTCESTANVHTFDTITNLSPTQDVNANIELNEMTAMHNLSTVNSSRLNPVTLNNSNLIQTPEEQTQLSHDVESQRVSNLATQQAFGISNLSNQEPLCFPHLTQHPVVPQPITIIEDTEPDVVSIESPLQLNHPSVSANFTSNDSLLSVGSTVASEKLMKQTNIVVEPLRAEKQKVTSIFPNTTKQSSGVIPRTIAIQTRLLPSVSSTSKKFVNPSATKVLPVVTTVQSYSNYQSQVLSTSLSTMKPSPRPTTVIKIPVTQGTSSFLTNSILNTTPARSSRVLQTPKLQSSGGSQSKGYVFVVPEGEFRPVSLGGNVINKTATTTQPVTVTSSGHNTLTMARKIQLIPSNFGQMIRPHVSSNDKAQSTPSYIISSPGAFTAVRVSRPPRIPASFVSASVVNQTHTSPSKQLEAPTQQVTSGLSEAAPRMFGCNDMSRTSPGNQTNSNITPESQQIIADMNNAVRNIKKRQQKQKPRKQVLQQRNTVEVSDTNRQAFIYKPLMNPNTSLPLLHTLGSDNITPLPVSRSKQQVSPMGSNLAHLLTSKTPSISSAQKLSPTSMSQTHLTQTTRLTVAPAQPISRPSLQSHTTSHLPVQCMPRQQRTVPQVVVRHPLSPTSAKIIHRTSQRSVNGKLSVGALVDLLTNDIATQLSEGTVAPNLPPVNHVDDNLIDPLVIAPTNDNSAPSPTPSGGSATSEYSDSDEDDDASKIIQSLESQFIIQDVCTLQQYPD